MNLFTPVRIPFTKVKDCNDGQTCYVFTYHPYGKVIATFECRRNDEVFIDDVQAGHAEF